MGKRWVIMEVQFLADSYYIPWVNAAQRGSREHRSRDARVTTHVGERVAYAGEREAVWERVGVGEKTVGLTDCLFLILA